jgi:hypothetical protein
MIQVFISVSHRAFKRHITNLEFIGCGGNKVFQVKDFLVTDTTFEGRENSGTALELIGTTAQIVNSTFVSNRNGSYRESVQGDFDVFVGGAIIATDNTTVTISHSWFEDNKAEYGGAIFAYNYSIIHLNDNDIVSFVNSLARVGVLYSSRGVIATIKSSIFYDNYASEGFLLLDKSSITIEASEFHDNIAGEGGLLSSINSNMIVEGSVFYSNCAINGRGVLIIICIL